MSELALWPFAAVLGLEVYGVAQLQMPEPAALLAAIMISLVALFFWFGLGWIKISKGCGAKERAMSAKQEREKPQPTELFDKVDHVLTECRVVIPGAQALLGFQFIAMLTAGFNKLPKSSQHVHLAAMLLIGLSLILLMTPAAYHRIVEAGEPSEEFWRTCAGCFYRRWRFCAGTVGRILCRGGANSCVGNALGDPRRRQPLRVLYRLVRLSDLGPLDQGTPANQNHAAD